MWCEPPSTSSPDSIEPTASNSLTPKQLPFLYQPAVGLHDKKKTELDQDVRIEDLAKALAPADLAQHRPPSPVAKAPNLYKSYLRRQNEQDSLPIRQKLHTSDTQISTSPEKEQKRKVDQNSSSNKKLRQSIDVTSILMEQPTFPIKPRTYSTDRPHKHSIAPIVKSIPMVKKLSSEIRKSDEISLEKEAPSQGLLLCPKEEPMKKKKKKKITSASTALLHDDPVLDSILFNEIQSVQQQWQQFLLLTMEKELHINPFESKKKGKHDKFHRSEGFLLAYENLYDFEGMKHWCPTSR